MIEEDIEELKHAVFALQDFLGISISGSANESTIYPAIEGTYGVETDFSTPIKNLEDLVQYKKKLNLRKEEG